MKLVKTGSIAAIMLFATTSFSQALTGMEKKEVQIAVEPSSRLTPEELAKEQTDRLNEALVLNDNQRASIYETNVAINYKNEAVRKHESWNDAQKQEALDGNNAGRNNLIKMYLNDEQIAKFEKMNSNTEKRVVLEKVQMKEEIREEVAPAH